MKPTKAWIAAPAVSLLCLSVWATRAPHEQLHTAQYENVLGTSLEFKVRAGNAEAAREAEAAALAEIDREAKILSAYDTQSEFSRWVKTRGQAVKVSPELFAVLQMFDQWREQTGGALDASAETVVRVWKRAAAEHRVPAQPELDAAVQTVKQRHWQLDPVAQTATHLDDAPLALNSFAKSYIVGRAADAAMSVAAGQVHGVVVNIGGDLVVRGDVTEPVRIADARNDSENSSPLATLLVQDRAVATSGNYRRGVEIAGQHYSHIIDPRTGRTAEEIVSATVVAKNPADAGAMATAFSVMSPEESKRVAANRRDVEFLLVQSNGREVASAGWSRLTMKPAAFAMMAPAPPAAAGTWNTGEELVINLELSRPDEGRYKRPYVAVWIEDKDKFPVRTIALWYQKPRWLPDLTAWSHDDRLRSMAEGSDITSSVASATRPPGKYTLKWDGKDNSGKLVKAGKYTVCIEAAREHGTHQVMRQEMDFTGTPKQVSLPGNTEIAGATLDYRKAGSSSR